MTRNDYYAILAMTGVFGLTALVVYIVSPYLPIYHEVYQKDVLICKKINDVISQCEKHMVLTTI